MNPVYLAIGFGLVAALVAIFSIVYALRRVQELTQARCPHCNRRLSDPVEPLKGNTAVAGSTYVRIYPHDGPLS